MRDTRTRDAVELVAEGRRIVAEVERSREQYTAALTTDSLNWNLSEAIQAKRALSYARRLSAKVEVWREWVLHAYVALGGLAANPPPPPVRDERTRFFRLHDLVSMPVATRVEALNAAVVASDRLTFDVVCEAPAFVKLIPAADLTRAKRRWAELHSIHPHPLHPQLAEVHAQVVAAVNEIAQKIRAAAATTT